MQKDHKIENIRALAIITVVLGHSIILYSHDWGLYKTNQSSLMFYYVLRLVDIYQMPLFFSISGYLFAKFWKNSNLSKYILHKFKRLIIPFLTIALLWMIPVKMLVHYPYYEGMPYHEIIIRFLKGYHIGHLWYLPTLLFIFIMAQCAVRVFGNLKRTFIVMYAATIFLFFMENRLPSFSLPYPAYICHFAWGFMLGALIFKLNLLDLLKPFSPLIIAVAIILSVVQIYNSNRFYSIVPASFIVLSLYLITPNKENMIMKAISENSYGIYLFHSPLIYITFTFFANSKPIVLFVLNFILFGSLSYIMSVLIKKSHFKMVIGE